MLKIQMLKPCTDESCKKLAKPLWQTLQPKYAKEHAILSIPDDPFEWLATHRTARKRAKRASDRGYDVRPFERADYTEDLMEINRSLPERQGRTMGEHYTVDGKFWMGRLPEYPCKHHKMRQLGVFDVDKLCAYISFDVASEFANISQVLGHGLYLADEIMYLLFRSVVFDCDDHGVRFIGYNMWNGGTAGLQFFKERVGFRPEDVEWVL